MRQEGVRWKRGRIELSPKITGEAYRLRVYVGESAHYHHLPLYHAIVLEARKMGLAGATVVRAMEGYGPSNRIHTANLIDLSADLPIVIEIVDSEEYLTQFMTVLDGMVTGGLVTLDRVHVVQYGKVRRNMVEGMG